ncbi:MAG: phosphoribosylglycinamide formyltransferase [Clostridiales bacterium]|nr:phosphoribosylglycinamide formyltransferase [Clostridiales bacterium]
MTEKIRIAVMVSGSGTNLQALIDAVNDGRLEAAEIALVLSSRTDAYALTRAERAGVPAVVVSNQDFPDAGTRADAILRALSEARIDLIVMAGYMSILSPRVCSAYAGRMINIHPALLPKYGGIGYYGLHVHEAVLAAGESESGATVHYVDDVGVDHGDIILQARVPVLPDDTPETLQARVHEAEYGILVQATGDVCRKIIAERGNEQE